MADREHEPVGLKAYPELGEAIYVAIGEDGRQKIRKLAEEACRDEGQEVTPENVEAMLRWFVDKMLPCTFLSMD